MPIFKLSLAFSNSVGHPYPTGTQHEIAERGKKLNQNCYNVRVDINWGLATNGSRGLLSQNDS